MKKSASVQARSFQTMVQSNRSNSHTNNNSTPIFYPEI